MSAFRHFAVMRQNVSRRKIGKKVGENFVGKEKMPTFAAESETPGEVGEWLKQAVC